IHLGMSGSVRILPIGSSPKKHDHADIVFADCLLRLNDPRRFGALLWHEHSDGDLEQHSLFKKLGVEPLQDQFTAAYLFAESRSHGAPIKQVLLAGEIVVGVGNIYASESLFKAKIHPKTAANRISLRRYATLVTAIREVLLAAIAQGGSSLKDFVGADGQSGYFQQSYFVYDRQGEPCRLCQGTIRHIKQGQRSTFYCVNCQK
ncbi:MAG: bifunctional DNA-formamidopyrimidine glycosylase/DNA-(apurinic or apyrimidinic site) lyase, partial [Undibacterium sp.]|nr:bifunctional DNA-formamidopyrimidine glycosylase/DNA-(apurinic or apyrimidinic site) lyase [Undibacterium sp.]